MQATNTSNRSSRIGRHARLMASCAVLSGLFIVSAVGSADAQSVQAVTAPGTSIFSSDWGLFGDRSATTGKTVIVPSEKSFQIGSWVVQGGVNAGAVYNDNLFGTENNKVSSWGFGVAPAFVAEHSTGVMKTTVYGALNADFYEATSKADTVTGRGGVVNLWEVQRDLSIRAQLDYYRGVYYPGGNASSIAGQNVYSDPEGYNQYFGSVGVHKDFGQMFADFGGSISRTDYSNPSAAQGVVLNLTSPDGTIYSVAGRLGYNISPSIYVFVDPRVNWWSYQDSAYDSTGYRVVGGVGTDRIGLFRGELYAGYQVQDFGSSSFGDVDMPVYGGAVSWFPTRMLTFKLTADQTIAVSSPSLLFNTGNLAVFDSYVTKNTNVNLTGTYEISRQWLTKAGLSYTHSDYVDDPRVDNIWSATAGVTYMMVNNWGIDFSYSYNDLDSNIVNNSYTQNIFRISARGQL